eukprot:1178855-Prorocentrum_minimum.AAC.3
MRAGLSPGRRHNPRSTMIFTYTHTYGAQSLTLLHKLRVKPRLGQTLNKTPLQHEVQSDSDPDSAVTQ